MGSSEKEVGKHRRRWKWTRCFQTATENVGIDAVTSDAKQCQSSLKHSTAGTATTKYDGTSECRTDASTEFLKSTKWSNRNNTKST